MPTQIIFVGVYLLSGGSARDQITPCPLPDCPDAQCDPESLCVSQQHISRTTSVLALPGFGYMPGFFSKPFDCQLASPRYVRLNGQSDATLNGVARYNSVPCLVNKPPLPSQSLSAEVADTDKASVASVLARGQSVPIMVRFRDQTQSLSPDSDQLPQSMLSSSRPAAGVGVGLFSPPLLQPPAASLLDCRITAIPNVTSGPAQLPVDIAPTLGAFAPVVFRLQSTTSDVLAQLLDSLPGSDSQTNTADQGMPNEASRQSDLLS